MNEKAIEPSIWRHATVVLLGHGTEENAGSAGAVRLHVRWLREKRRFADVREAFWKQAPQVQDVLAELTAPVVFVVPLFMAEGYFAARVIPESLGLPTPTQPSPAWPRIRFGPDRTLVYCAPVGTHPRLMEVVLARAEGVVRAHPFPRLPRPDEISLFLAGHGTEREAQSRRSVEELAQRIAGLGRYACVGAVFLDEEPRIPACYERAVTRRMVVVPAFMSDGLHTMEDIPVLLGEPERVVKQRLESGQFPWRNPTERHGRWVWYTPALGSEPALQEIILERIREATEHLRPERRPS